ncbi:hypothetical protein TEA_018479 [Camellia sinensis var. sinensis]|uniref:Glycoside hydrolase family 19 catalytic domain-containing protein n=1 Tax=Camellia sinensis var. sinensis TaxID=542762 RepID=A0A4V3WPQ2_CAMSN|nr:hypothetical protein TEA_018479 [Camellia sinensis var. sinensis]
MSHVAEVIMALLRCFAVMSKSRGGWDVAPSGRFLWGYCRVKEVLSIGEALELDVLNNPDLAETDPVISFETAVWFWMTTQSPKPSCHDVIIGNWTPMPDDLAASRVPWSLSEPDSYLTLCNCNYPTVVAISSKLHNLLLY